jgi:hypothetical protein
LMLSNGAMSIGGRAKYCSLIIRKAKRINS